MLCLAFETATRALSVALLEDDTVLAFFQEKTGYTHSERLLPVLAETLEQANRTLADLDLLAVGRGPGSYTGIRIGLATALGLAAQETPIVTVSTLRVLAAGAAGTTLAALDARGGRVFAGVYRQDDCLLTDRAGPADLFLETVKQEKIPGPYCLAGDGSVVLASLLPERAICEQNAADPDARVLARLALADYRAGRNEGRREDVRAFYAAPTQAERLKKA